MDTKWKKFKALLSWTLRLCVVFWLVIAIFALKNVGSYEWNMVEDALQNSPQQNTYWFRDAARNLFNNMIAEVSRTDEYEDRTPNTDWLDSQRDNIKYYAENKVTGVTIGNFHPVNTHVPENIYRLHIVLQDGEANMYVGGWELPVDMYVLPKPIFKVLPIKPETKIDTSSFGFDEGAVNYEIGTDETEIRSDGYYYMKDYYAVLWVKAPLGMTVTNSSLVVTAKSAEFTRIGIYVLLGLSFVILLLAIILFRLKKNADRAIAKVTRHIWLELKLAALALGVGLIAVAIEAYTLEGLLFVGFPSAIVLYILWSDLLVNKGRVFTHNSIHSVISAWRGYVSKKTFQKGMLTEYNVFIFVEICLVSLASLFFTAAFAGNEAGWLILTLIFAAAGLLLLRRFSRRYKRMINDLGQFVDHVAEMNRGRFEKEMTVPEDAVLYPVAQSVNGIQDSFVSALQNATKSERMKVDLVTNVSHDLKTPLTSIIGYVELLSQMELPDEAAEHVKIISHKSERLKLLIQDLFDLSKSTSGSIELNLEALDLARLAEQTLSDADCGDSFKVKLADRPLWIRADGSKLSRALHNLIDNAKKYSLTDTRVYIDTYRDSERAILEIKNIANYEMSFNPAEVIERFIRGDASRSTEGSGLGLSIAHSFTESCGGTFKVTVDGDMFKVRMSFAICAPPAPHDWQAQQ